MDHALTLTSTAQLLWSTWRIRLLAWRAHRRRLREQRETLAALGTLDAAMLRDLGIRPCEASSLAAEACGLAEVTRRGVRRAAGDLA